MIVWKDLFSGADIGWLLITSVVSAVLCLLGLVQAFSSTVQHDGRASSGQSFLIYLSAMTAAWSLWIFSLCFAPSAGTVPEVDPNPRPMMSLQRMMEVEDAQPDETHLYGRGGVIGSLLYAEMQHTMPVIGEGKPNFPARRPNFHLPLLLEFLFRWSSYLLISVPLLAIWARQFSGVRLILLMAAWATFVYAPVTHAVSGDGWLEEYGCLDFSLGLPVLACCSSAIAGGKRKPSSQNIVSNNETWEPSALGLLNVWIGLSLHVGGYAFHADGRAVIAVVNMLIGSSCGMLVWSFCNSFLWNRPMYSHAGVGMLAGIAAILPGAGLMLPQSSLIAGCVVVSIVNPVFHAAGKWTSLRPSTTVFLATGLAVFFGLIATGVFATTGVAGYRWDGREIMGLVQGDASQLSKQLLAAAVVMVWSGLVSWLLTRIFDLFHGKVASADPSETDGPAEQGSGH